MYNKTDWRDHVVQFPKTYTMQTNPDGTITLTEAPGEVIQQGTPMNAAAFNNIEGGILLLFNLMETMRDMVRTMATSGVREFGTNLQVIPDGENMSSRILAGSAIVQGYPFDTADDTTLTHDAGEENPRLDRVVIRLDTAADPIAVTLAILKGVASETPAAPELTRAEGIYEISLALVSIPAYAAQIGAEQITDERTDEALCGAVTPAVLRLSALSEMISGIVGQAMGPESTPTFGGMNLNGALDMKGNQIINGTFG